MIKAKASISACTFIPRDGDRILTWRKPQACWPRLRIFVVSTASLKWIGSQENKADEYDTSRRVS